MNGKSIQFRVSAICRLVAYGLLITFAAALGGCTGAPSQVVAPPSPVYPVQSGTWRAIDEQILIASVRARHESEAYARVFMEEWQWRVRQRTDEVFIPWYSTYWTQQWIATKVAWYKLLYTEGEATPEERLVDYLQEQFYEQVLEPVSSFVDPQAVMEDAAANYLRELKHRLDQLPQEYHVPVTAFNQHLESIPAIVVPSDPLQDASLYEVLQAADLSDLPVYEILLGQITDVDDPASPTPSPDRLHRVVRRAVTKLVDSMALRGSTTTASAIMGGFWGVIITAGSTVWGVTEHEHDKPAMEAQLLENLDAALELIWHELVEDQRGGITALVHLMSVQIERGVFR